METENNQQAAGSSAATCSRVVAFDIDDTWTLDPTAWRDVWDSLTESGFTCVIVTGADQPADKILRLSIPFDAPIVVAKNELKRDAARQAGYEVSVWIDDLPGTIEPCRVLEDNLDLPVELGATDPCAIISNLLAAMPESVKTASTEDLVEALLDMDGADEETRDTAQALLEARRFLSEND